MANGNAYLSSTVKNITSLVLEPTDRTSLKTTPNPPKSERFSPGNVKASCIKAASVPASSDPKLLENFGYQTCKRYPKHVLLFFWHDAQKKKQRSNKKMEPYYAIKISKSTLFGYLNPEFASKNPEFASKNPEFASKNPEFASKNPEFASKNPEFASKNPEFASKNPEFASKNPEFASKNPEFASKNPEFASKNPEFASKRAGLFEMCEENAMALGQELHRDLSTKKAGK